MVLVSAVEAHTPAMLADVREGDIVVSINDSKVATTKHAMLIMRKTGDTIALKVERGPVMMSARAGRREAAPTALSGSDTFLESFYPVRLDCSILPLALSFLPLFSLHSSCPSKLLPFFRGVHATRLYAIC